MVVFTGTTYEGEAHLHLLGLLKGYINMETAKLSSLGSDSAQAATYWH